MKKACTKAIYGYLAVYLAVNLLFLGRFPFMHSDESWLSGLSRAMMSGGPAVTEPFFDLLPRYPHAIKILFHIMQMPFILMGGYGLYSVRLLSLFWGIAALYFLYRLVVELTGRPFMALAVTVLLSLDVQFVYASHFARQEIILTAAMLGALWFLYRHIGHWRLRHDMALGLLLGLCAGIHPNALLIAMAVGGACLYLWWVEGKLKGINILRIVGMTAAGAALFAGISFVLDPGFPAHYLAYGSDLGVSASLGGKLAALVPYYRKFFLGVSGTYYTPPVKIQLILFTAGIAASAVLGFFRRKALRFLFPILALQAGMIIIGRYSQPSVVLLFPLGYLLILDLASLIRREPDSAMTAAGTPRKKANRLPVWAAVVLIPVMAVNTIQAVVPYLNNDYGQYLSRLSRTIPSGAPILANLNAGYAFDQGALRDYRNLAYLDEAGLTFAEYIDRNQIEYIALPEEMDFIYENRPVWNVLYGNVYPYYRDMTEFLDERCTLVDEFQSPYAMRITAYAQEKPWTVRVYRVKEDPS